MKENNVILNTETITENPEPSVEQSSVENSQIIEEDESDETQDKSKMSHVEVQYVLKLLEDARAHYEQYASATSDLSAKSETEEKLEELNARIESLSAQGEE